MAAHEMRLNPAPFRMIKSGEKTIELRLYDEKRRKIAVGDTITFTETETGEKLRVTVTALHVFPSFDELYRALPLTECGYTEAELSSANPDDMLVYYSKERQQKYGVVGIAVAVLCQDVSVQKTTLSSAFGCRITLCFASL